MDQPDFRALCAELVDKLRYYADEHSVDELIACTDAALAIPPSEPPTEEELMALEKKLWDKYKTIPYQGDEFMYDDGFEYALCDYRSILEVRWGK